MNDLAGDMQSYDRQYLGTMAIVSGDFTRWNNQLLLQMWSMPNPFATPGLNPGGDYGTFLIQEGFAFPLILQNPYASLKASMAGLETGLMYYAAWLMGPDDKTIGTRANKARCIWMCHPIFVPDQNNSVRASLYTTVIPSVPSIT